MKRDMDAMKLATAATGTTPGGGGGGAASAATNAELVQLRNRVQTLEKDLLNAELELKNAQKQLKERPTEGQVGFDANARKCRNCV